MNLSSTKSSSSANAMISSKLSRATLGEMPISEALRTTLSRAVSYGLKPTPSSRNGETRPAISIFPLVGW